MHWALGSIPMQRSWVVLKGEEVWSSHLLGLKTQACPPLELWGQMKHRAEKEGDCGRHRKEKGQLWRTQDGEGCDCGHRTGRRRFFLLCTNDQEHSGPHTTAQCVRCGSPGLCYVDCAPSGILLPHCVLRTKWSPLTFTFETLTRM